MIEDVRDLEDKLLFLSRVLPPIAYSYRGNNVSIFSNIGAIKTTEGGTSEDQVAFRAFLEGEGALATYIINVFNSSRVLGMITTKVRYIGGAFSWASTPEGQYYWSTKHMDWNNLISN